MTSPQRSELFMSSCGAPAVLAVQVQREGQAGIDHRLFETPFILIGRSERSSLRLDDGQVSKRHAYLQMIAGGLFCIDLGSRTGVRWNGIADVAGWVNPGDRLALGPFVLGLAGTLSPQPEPERPALPTDPLESDAAAASPGTPWTLELPNGVHWRINRPLTLLGKSPLCKLWANSSDVSQFHCSLVRTPRGIWAIDLLSRKGTFLNGEPMTCALLHQGDELRIGSLVLRFRDGTPDTRSVSVNRPESSATSCLSPSPASDTHPVPPAVDNQHDVEVPSPRSYALAPRPPVLGPLALPSGIPGQNPILPAAPGSKLSEGLLGPVISQFSLMQQQMLEQFHQTMMMMAQVFGNLHRDQMGLIREELSQLHRVTQELQTLHMELATRPPSPPAGASVSLPTRGADNGHKGAPPQPASAPRGVTPRAESPSAPTGAQPAPTPGPPSAPAESPEAIHDLLCRRMAALEQERKSRWDKILRFMRGQ